MKRKLIEIGNSVGITIPKAVREYLNIKQGDEIKIETIEKVSLPNKN